MDQKKLLLSPEEACAALGVKRAHLFKMLAEGEIQSIKIGRLRRIPVAGLKDWVERQVEAQLAGQEGAR